MSTHLKEKLDIYYTGKYGYAAFNYTNSCNKKHKNHVPQGSVLSITLFKFFMHDNPTPKYPNAQILLH